MEWADLTPEQRKAAYASRMELIAGLVGDAREHRESGVCTLEPLCPGAEAVHKLRSLDDGDVADVLASLLAFSVDRVSEIDTLHRESAKMAQTLAITEGARARAEVESERHRIDADDGWRAFRKTQAKLDAERKANADGQ